MHIHNHTYSTHNLTLRLFTCRVSVNERSNPAVFNIWCAVWDQLVLLKLLIREEGEHLVQHTIDRQYGSYLSLSLANIL